VQIGNSFNYQQRTELNVTIQSLGGASVNLCNTLCTYAYMLVELLLIPSCSLGRNINDIIIRNVFVRPAGE